MIRINIGDVCKVTRSGTHEPCQLGDLLLVVGYLGGSYDTYRRFVKAINLKTNRIHHYRSVELEIICSKSET